MVSPAHAAPSCCSLWAACVAIPCLQAGFLGWKRSISIYFFFAFPNPFCVLNAKPKSLQRGYEQRQGGRREGAGGCSCPHHRVPCLGLAPHRFANGPATVTHLSPPVWPHVPSPRASATFIIRCSRAGQAVTPRSLGSLAAMLMGGDGKEGLQAAPGDGVGEDRVTHRDRPLLSQGAGDMGSLSLHPVPRDSV